MKTANGGVVLENNLRPGIYTVTELVENKYEPQETRRVTVVSGQTSTVTFSNVLKRSDLSVVKTSKDNMNEGVKFRLHGTSLAGLAVDEYAVTDKNGIAVFKDVLISGNTPYILILGNSGQGKSYLLKLILTNLRESGKSLLCLDPESEYEELCASLGVCYIDFLSGEYTINPLEPKAWNDSTYDADPDAPAAFKKVTRLSQHIAFLKDFFRSYKDFTDTQIDTIEILLSKLYARFGITDSTDYSKMKPTDYPIMSDFYKLCEEEFMTYDSKRKYLYTDEILQEVCLGIHSMCIGAESKYFNGHTNIIDKLSFCSG